MCCVVIAPGGSLPDCCPRFYPLKCQPHFCVPTTGSLGTGSVFLETVRSSLAASRTQKGRSKVKGLFSYSFASFAIYLFLWRLCSVRRDVQEWRSKKSRLNLRKPESKSVHLYTMAMAPTTLTEREMYARARASIGRLSWCWLSLASWRHLTATRLV